MVLLLPACGGSSGAGQQWQQWPEITVENLANGEPMSSRAGLGVETARPAVVAVWAVWCQPCRKELPALQELMVRRGGEVLVMGINHGDDAAVARGFLVELGVTFPSLRDPDGRLVSALGVVSLPATFVVNARGEVTWSRLGIVDVAEVEAALAALEGGTHASGRGPMEG
jgi:thiol-disulfide isomerase/thioredoxin